ncbi:MAG: hypothetical protein DCC71_17455 [Proteobacteria bacterium]|nr:MAG: hypothetical protein DCC71_17455 [Pseudomonadota bacterium]
MRITRLFLGALAPLAVVSPAFGADDSATGAAPAADAAASAPAARRSVAMGPAVRDGQGNEGRVHTVVTGDTLWDISEAYLGSPFSWPSVWKNNPAVRNPHRIYPGDKIWISATEMRPITPQEASTYTPSTSFDGDAVVKPVGIFPVPHMERIGLVSAEELETAGSVLGTPEGEKWLAAHRRAYVSLGDGQTNVGDRYTVVRENERVKDPETGDTIGVHVEKLGWLEITQVGPESSEAIVRVSTAEMQAGDRLIPRIAPALEVPVRIGGGGAEGQIALVPDARTITAQRDVLFLNRGSDAGVDVGTTLEVYRPGEVVKDRETKQRHTLPDEVVANLVVVSARPESAVAIVTHSTVELVRGARFRSAADTTTSFRAPMTPPLDGARWTARTIEGENAGKQPPAKAAPAR